MKMETCALFGVCMIATLSGRVYAADYPRDELLVEPAQLADAQAAKQFVILDARERGEYEKGHVPGAVWVDHGEWSKAFDNGKNAKQWSERIGSLGIGADSQVVVYDDSHTKNAARIWWLLRFWGVENAKLLNGGWVAWKAGGHPVETDSVAKQKVEFVAKPRPARLATKEQVLKSLDDNSLQIVDARSEDEYCGINKLKNKRGGAIPGAKHLEWIDLLDQKTHRFKPAAELRQLFKQAGIDLSKPAATHCQSGGRAAVMAFGLELMGADDVSNYYSSWGEWGNAEDTPVETPKPKSKD